MMIRFARPSDSEAIAKIQIDTWKQAYKTVFPEEFLQAISYDEKTRLNNQWLQNLEETTRVFIAEGPSKDPIGFAVGGQERENHPEYHGELWGLYVLNEHQRKGIGTKLFMKVVDHLKNINLNSMLVWVLKDNPYCAYYKKLKGILLEEKQQDFGPFKRSIVSYGWLDIRTLKC